jgi:hypothetical protein
MPIIESQLHPIKYYLQLTLVAIAGFGFSILLLLEVIGVVQISEKEIENWIKVVAAVFFFVVIIHFLKVYSKSAVKLIVFDNHLTWNDDYISFSDINSIQLIGKVNMPFLFLSFPMNGINIQLKDGTNKILFDSFYKNTSEIKQSLEQVVLLKKSFQPYYLRNIKAAEVKISNAIKYKGIQWFTWRGLFLWTMVIMFMATLLVIEGNSSFFIKAFMVLVVLSFFLLFSFFMNYFLITDDYIVVKNHNICWKSRIIAFKDIREVLIEEDGKWPKTLVIHTRDYRKHEFPASTLRKKQWFSLWRALRRKGIEVVNLAF